MANQDQLKLGRTGAWTDEETARLVLMGKSGFDARTIAKALGRTHQSVALRISGLQKRHAAKTVRARRAWSEEDVATLESMMAVTASYADIATTLKRTEHGIRQYVSKHKIQSGKVAAKPQQILTKPMPQPPAVKPITLSAQGAWVRPEPQTHRNAAWAAVAVAAALGGFILGGLAQ